MSSACGDMRVCGCAVGCVGVGCGVFGCRVSSISASSSVDVEGEKVSEQEEGDGQQARAEHITQGGQVGDGEVVRIFATPPQVLHQPVRQVEQQQHLHFIYF